MNFNYQSAVQVNLKTIDFSELFALICIWMLFYSSVDDDDDQGGEGLGYPVYQTAYEPVYEPVYSVNPS